MTQASCPGWTFCYKAHWQRGTALLTDLCPARLQPVCEPVLLPLLYYHSAPVYPHSTHFPCTPSPLPFRRLCVMHWDKAPLGYRNFLWRILSNISAYKAFLCVSRDDSEFSVSLPQLEPGKKGVATSHHVELRSAQGILGLLGFGGNNFHSLFFILPFFLIRGLIT